MAQQVKVVLVDDLDGGKADETVAFALDGTSYEIDLSNKNAAKLRDVLAPYVGAARKTSRRGGARAGARRQSGGGNARERAAEIRAWARDQGLNVNERGRIPGEIVAQYEAAH